MDHSLVQMDFGWREEARSLQPLRTGNAVVTFTYKFPQLTMMCMWVWRSGKAARFYSSIEMPSASPRLARPLRAQNGYRQFSECL